MRLKTLAVLSLLPFVLVACAPTVVTPPSSTATPVPELSVTREPPTQIPTPVTVPATNTAAPAATVQPTKAAATPTVAPTATAPASTPTIAKTATVSASTPQVRPTPTSSGPLAATIYVANCRSAPTTDKPGQVIIQISVEATGGNGVYHYFYQGKEVPSKFIDVAGERGTRVLGEVTVQSGDQTIKKTFDISTSDLNCP